MPISMDAYRQPKWIRYREKQPFSVDKKDKFYKFETNLRSFRGGDFKQAGYNTNHDSTTVEKVNLKSDNYTLKPY
jgi:hypothetical protein